MANPHLTRTLAAALLVLGFASTSAAQSDHPVSLKFPTILWLTAGAEDMVSTVYGATQPEAGCLRERNPFINGLSAHPVVMVAVGAAEEVTLVGVLHHYVAARHPKVFRGLLFAIAGAHHVAAVGNLSNAGRWCGAR